MANTIQDEIEQHKFLSGKLSMQVTYLQLIYVFHLRWHHHTTILLSHLMMSLIHRSSLEQKLSLNLLELGWLLLLYLMQKSQLPEESASTKFESYKFIQCYDILFKVPTITFARLVILNNWNSAQKHVQSQLKVSCRHNLRQLLCEEERRTEKNNYDHRLSRQVLRVGQRQIPRFVDVKHDSIKPKIFEYGKRKKTFRTSCTLASSPQDWSICNQLELTTKPTQFPFLLSYLPILAMADWISFGARRTFSTRGWMPSSPRELILCSFSFFEVQSFQVQNMIM